MKRRGFIQSIACSTAALVGLSPGVVRAQSKPILIGWLHVGVREESGHIIGPFRRELAALGWKDGSQIVIEERWANGRVDRFPALAAELAALKPAIVVASSSQGVAAAAKAMPKTPIVHATGSDPVAAGFAASLARPGGMITGVANINDIVQEKFVELLLAIAPTVRRIVFLMDATALSRPRLLALVQESSARHRVAAHIEEMRGPAELDAALSRLAKSQVQALAVMSSPWLTVERRRIAKHALDLRWPSIAGNRTFAEAGGLLSYAYDSEWGYARTAYFVDRILKGAKPGELPFEQPTKIELVINRRTAAALGLAVPQDLLLRADKVIE